MDVLPSSGVCQSLWFESLYDANTRLQENLTKPGICFYCFLKCWAKDYKLNFHLPEAKIIIILNNNGQLLSAK